MKHGIHVELGSAPWEEDCAQVGQVDYLEQVRREIASFKRQIERHYPKPSRDDLATVKTSSSGHDFGSYLELEIVYDPGSQDAAEWAHRVETDPLAALARWDDEARAELLSPSMATA